VTRAPIIIGLGSVVDLIGNAHQEAFRLEVRRRYASDERTAAYAQWARGETPQWDMTGRYADVIAGRVAVGAHILRVRVLDEPATPGQLYLLAHAAGRAEPLGEDVRCMSRTTARTAGRTAARTEGLDLTGFGDFWLIDCQIGAQLIYDQDDEVTGALVLSEPADVIALTEARAAALRHAMPYRAYTEQPTTGC